MNDFKSTNTVIGASASASFIELKKLPLLPLLVLCHLIVTKLGLHCLIRALWKFQGRLLYLLLLLKR